MNPKVLTVREDMSVHALARFLVDNEITGAPVENASGKLVGVVSLVDIASAASDSGNVTSDQSNPDFFVRGWEDKIDLEEMIDFRLFGRGGDRRLGGGDDDAQGAPAQAPGNS